MQLTQKLKIILLVIGAIVIVAIAFFFFDATSTLENRDDNQLVTVTIPDGLRKEQTADILANSLGWNTEQETKFVVEDTARDINHAEGVLPSGTYEISTASSTYEVASMFLDRANERYQELGSGLSPDEWYEVLKVAAIAEREANSPTEMESIAQNIWQNRTGYIQSDATVQYVRDTLAMYPNKSCNGQDSVTSGMVEYDGYVGNSGGEERTVCLHWRLAYTGADEDYDWWQPVTQADRELPHGYNTYLYEGLPQHPIATPSQTAIEATLSARGTNGAVNTPSSNASDTELNANCTMDVPVERIDDVTFNPMERTVTMYWWDGELQDNKQLTVPYEPETDFAGCSASVKEVLEGVPTR